MVAQLKSGNVSCPYFSGINNKKIKEEDWQVPTIELKIVTQILSDC